MTFDPVLLVVAQSQALTVILVRALQAKSAALRTVSWKKEGEGGREERKGGREEREERGT